MIHFVNVCWGKEYSRTFVDVMLPLFLSPGNFAAPELAGRAKFILYTTPEDAARMGAAPSFQRLRQLMPVVLNDLSAIRAGLGQGDKYALMNLCHGHALRQASLENAAFSFLCPDMVVSDGLCRRLAELDDQGKTVVLVAGSHMAGEAFQREWATLRKSGPEADYPGLAPRELVGLALKTMNRFSRNNFWDSREVNLRPYHLQWRVGSSGYLLRGFHLHPMLVRSEVQGIVPIQTLDADYVERACPDFSRYHFVDDSDEMSVYTVCLEDEFPQLRMPGRYSELALAAYVLGRPDIGNYHLGYVRKALRFHAEDLDPAAWQAAADESGRIVDRIIGQVSRDRAGNRSPEQWYALFLGYLKARLPALSS